MPNKTEILAFSEQVERLVSTGGAITYMEAIMTAASRKGIEIEIAAKLLTPTVKEKLSDEAQTLNLIERDKRRKSKGKLPI